MDTNTDQKPNWPNYPARLRALRYALGRDNKLLSGDEFAARASMKPGTLRTIESGLRALNPGDESRIAEKIGAIWRNEKNGWYCVGDPERPYDAIYYELYTGAIAAGADQFEADSGAILNSLDALEKSLPPDLYRRALLGVHRLILDYAREAKISPEEIELIELMQPLKLPMPPRGDSRATKKAQRQRHAAKGTTFSPVGGKSDQNSAAASLETKPR
jgi:hypothetical protein